MTAQRVIEAAENYVQWLDPDSVIDQQADPILVAERNWAQYMLIEAVREMVTERAVTGRAG